MSSVLERRPRTHQRTRSSGRSSPMSRRNDRPPLAGTRSVVSARYRRPSFDLAITRGPPPSRRPPRSALWSKHPPHRRVRQLHESARAHNHVGDGDGGLFVDGRRKAIFRALQNYRERSVCHRYFCPHSPTAPPSFQDPCLPKLDTSFPLNLSALEKDAIFKRIVRVSFDLEDDGKKRESRCVKEATGGRMIWVV